jgi:hypothetical protein
MPGKPFTKKGWKQYHALRKDGKSKKSAARIVSAKKGTRLRKTRSKRK